jgi:CHAT domain-containing protein
VFPLKRSLWRLLGGCLFLALVLGVVYWRWVTSPQHLISSAYGERRTLELRLPDAAYGRLQAARSRGAIIPMNSSLLLEAHAAVLRGLERQPDNAELLDAEARIDILNLRYADAIREANQALEQRPQWRPAMIDLASAHFQRAEEEQYPSDYGEAIEQLSVVLQADPSDHVALFNRAIVEERLMMYHEALADCERFLRFDDRSAWSQEVLVRKEAIHKRIVEHERDAAQSLSSPAAFPALVARQPEQADRRTEAYLERATQEWLPKAFAGDRESQVALQNLSSLLADRHQDPWLRDLLKTPPSPGMTRATASLAEAISADAGRDPVRGQTKSQEAISQFLASRCAPGAFRASVERVYAMDRSRSPQQCLDAASSLLPLARRLGYRWAESQLLTERASCMGSLGQDGKGRPVALEALDVAEKSSYPTLRLRALGMAAALATNSRDLRNAWKFDVLGLTLYWTGSAPALRGHQFYTDLSRPAEDSGRLHLALGFSREAASIASAISNPIVAATSRFRVGRFASLVGQDEEAEQQIAASERLFDKLPNNSATQTYRTDCRIFLADLALRRHRLDDASRWLSEARQFLPAITNYPMIYRYFNALGEMYQRSGHGQLAERAHRSLVATSELALAFLKGDRDRQVWNRDMADGYSRLSEDEWTLHGNPAGALEIVESYRTASLRSRMAHPPLLAFASLESQPVVPYERGALELPKLRPEVTALVYAVFGDNLGIWLINKNGVSTRRVAISHRDLTLDIQRFRKDCSNRSSNVDGLRQGARRLYNILIAPVESELPPHGRLVFDLDSALAGIPLNALLAPSGEYFGLEYEVATIPAIAYFPHLRAILPLTSDATALVVGSPSISRTLASELPALPEADAEARHVASLFARSTFLGAEAATSAAVEREMGRAVVFHFAGHSISNASRVGLLLAEDSNRPGDINAMMLDAEVIAATNLPQCRLAVLSACTTVGLENDGAGDPQSLVRAFLDAGVPQVVASRWDVDSAATSTFMRLFYERLTRGGSAADALRFSAGRMKDQLQTTHPYYWAGFQLYGMI